MPSEDSGLPNSAALYRSLVNACPDPIVVVDTAGRIVFASPRARVLFGYKPDDAIEGATMLAAVAPFHHERAQANLARLWRDESAEPREYSLLRKDGTAFPASVIGSVMRSEAGRIEGAVLVIRDLTEQKQREATLRASEARFSAIFRANPIATTLSGARDARVVDVNDAFLQMSGFTRDVIGQTTIGLGLFADTGSRQAVLDRIRTEGRVQTIEARVPWKSGRTRDVIVSFELIDIDGEEYVLGMWRDVTERKEVERRLRASEQRFREVVEAINEVFWVVEQPEGRITYVSPNFENVWGRTADSLYSSPRIWVQSVHREDRRRVLRSVARMHATGGFKETYRIIRPDGTVRWIRARAYPVRDDSGMVRRVVGVAEDITEQKQLESRFLHTQRIEAVGTLASGIAHEMNNVLTPLLVASDLLKESCTAPGDQELLGMLEATARRGTAIVKQLLAFSRQAEPERGPLALPLLIDDVLRVVQATFPRTITVQRQLPTTIPSVVANPTQIHQVLLNLCLNARDAMPEGGVLSLGVEEVELGAGEIRLHPNAGVGPHVVISIRDTGRGIPTAIMPRIFDPFFTTKEPGNGTGLGLATASTIVKNHGGFITAESEPGAGALFRVYLPATSDSRPAGEAGHAPLTGAGTGQLVLLVDDEEPIRTTLARLLENCGYRVAVAASGEDALAMLRAVGDSIRLLVTDMMMPKLSGSALIREVRQTAPTLPIIAMTGVIEPHVVRELEELGVRELLRKPFLPRDIIDRVAQHARHPEPDRLPAASALSD